MTELATYAYADWKAPAADNQLVVWPAAAEILRQTHWNHQHLNSCQHVRFQGLPLGELRRRARAWIGHNHFQPLLATGHQTELYHPGVWVKNALIHMAAAAIGGHALHLAVDTDEPKHLHLRWPGVAEPITDDQSLVSGRWAGLLSAPTPQHLNHLMVLLSNSVKSWPFESSLAQMLESMRRQCSDSPDLSTLLVNATHEFDWGLGLRNYTLMASPLWGSEVFLIYAHHLLAHADDLAQHYNHALRDYRLEHDIHSPGRPMPDLVSTDDGLEVPFWIDDLARGERQRPQLQYIEGFWTLTLTNGERFAFNPNRSADEAGQSLGQFLRQARLRLSPRALTLTLFMRLLVVDNFVHGIGGGRYDQVLDRLIASFFNMAPPHFAVTTATLYFPTAGERQRVDLPALKQEGHRLRHNITGQSKYDLVKAIASAERGSSHRRQLYTTMHRQLAEHQQDPGLTDWQQRWQQAVQRDNEERVLFDRELFYALQPRDRLESLINRCADKFAR